MLLIKTIGRHRLLLRFRNVPLRAWLTTFLPVLVFFALVLQLGPYIQAYAFTSVSMRLPVTALSQSLAIPNFPDVFDYLSLSANPIVLIISAAATLAMFSALTLRGAALLAGSAVFLGWSVCDILLFVTGHDDIILFTSLVFNLVGGLVIAVLVFPLLCLYEYIGRESLRSRKTILLFPPIVIAAGLLISVATYYSMWFAYKPLPARFEVTFGAPATGVLAARNTSYPTELPASINNGVSFNMSPPRSVAEGAGVESSRGRLNVFWQGENPRYVYEVRIDFFENCVTPRDISGLQVPASVHRSGNIRQLRVRINEGPARLSVLGGSGNRYTLEPGVISLYSISAENGTGLTGISNNSNGDGRLSVNSSLPLRFFISIPMTKGTVNAISSVPRSLSVSLDGAIQNWRFQRGRGWQPNRRLRCHRIDDSASTLDLDGVYVGALVTIDRNAGSQRDANSGDGNLAVSDFYGASTISRFDYLHTVQRQLGNTDVFSVRGNVTRLTVDDRTLDLTPDVGVVALGDLYGQVTESGQRRVSGIAYGVWSDQGFLSPTRWQKLDTDWQIFLVTIVGGILTTLGTILRRTFARAALDERLTIYAS